MSSDQLMSIESRLRQMMDEYLAKEAEFEAAQREWERFNTLAVAESYGWGVAAVARYNADREERRSKPGRLAQEINELVRQGQGLQEERKALITKAGSDHRGGFHDSQHGWIGDRAVTFSLGWGTKEGHTLIADGHISHDAFRNSRNHDHYGPGDGPNNNGTLRGRYSGPGK